jgi:polyphosphate kinase
VRLELRKGSERHLKKFLIKKIKADPDTVDEIEEFVGTYEISQILEQGKKEFYFKKFNSRQVERVNQFNGDYFKAIKSKDMIVHHPYETLMQL